jgi:hypothetical protein
VEDAVPDGLLDALQELAAVRGANAHRLHRDSGLPYAVARRLLQARSNRVVAGILTVLGVLGAEVWVIDGRGDCRRVAQPRADLERGERLRRRDIAMAAATRRPRARASAGGGRATLGKGEMVRLYRDAGASVGAIARRSGVSAERVRRLVREAGCPTARARALAARRSAFG